MAKVDEKEKKESQQPKQPERYVTAVNKCKREFDVDRAHKGFYVEEMDEIDKLYRNQHWDLLRPDGAPLRTRAQQAKRPSAVENITFALTDGMVSEFATLPDLVYFPIDPTDEGAATVTTDVVKHLGDKNYITEEYEKWRTNFFWRGTGIWEHVWDPSWTGGKGPNRWLGDVRWRSVHPRAILPDARCGDSIHKGTRIHKVCPVTLEHIREKYPEWGKDAVAEIIEQEYLSSDEDGATDDTDDEVGRVLLIETWYTGRPRVLDKGEKDDGSGLHVIWWCGESQGLYLKHANYVNFEPGEDVRFPFTFRQFKIRDGSVWGYGAPHFIKQIQIIHNKNVELMIEGHAHSALGRGFYNAGALSPKQKQDLQENGNLPGWMQEVNDVAGIEIKFGQSMPASLQNETIRNPKAAESVLGRPDVAQGRNPGSVTAAAAIDLLQKKAASRYVSVDLAITSAWQEAGQYIARLVWRNYTEQRAYRVVGVNTVEDKLELQRRGVFKMDDFLKVWDKQTGMVAPRNAFVPPEGTMLEGNERFEVYEPELDVRCKTSQQMPSDRMVNIEWGMKLLQTGAIDLELFLTVIEKGRFPAWSEVKDRYLALQQQQQEMAMMAAQNGQAPQPKVSPKLLSIISEMSPEEATKAYEMLKGLRPEQQEAALAEMESAA